MNISDTTTVRDLATGIPGAKRVFENFGIDYCCGGHRTLVDACREASLPVVDLTRSLEEAGRASQPGGAERDWRQESLTALTEHIIDTHHSFTRLELDRLGESLRQGLLAPRRKPSGIIRGAEDILSTQAGPDSPHAQRGTGSLSLHHADGGGHRRGPGDSAAVLRHGAKSGADDDDGT